MIHDVSNFIFFGVVGLLVEIIFTALRKRSISLVGHTSLWMFPIYGVGLTYGFDLIHYLIENNLLRWLSYPIWIWIVEILFGRIFFKLNIKAWDYRYLPDKFHWRGVISFAHFPIWIVFGIFIELIRGANIYIIV